MWNPLEKPVTPSRKGKESNLRKKRVVVNTMVNIVVVNQRGRGEREGGMRKEMDNMHLPFLNSRQPLLERIKRI